ncbi:hypothetical protein [Frankia sp. AgB32]|uniref:hypothetical protein n=1 Tax=Frankia sp. AgB32 TaxID=631119 RepID=UPI00200EC84C|nr:hypothetical protein [Frankia sp. AgB32]MCK9895218.1 hypothetical protein [Frankia sp. AgB32]
MGQADLFHNFTETPDTRPPAGKPEMTDDELDAEIARLDAAWDTFLTDRIPFLVTDACTQFDQHTAALAAWERKGRTAKGRANRGDKPKVWSYRMTSAEQLAVAWIGQEAAELIVARVCDASPHVSLGEVADALCGAGIDPDGPSKLAWLGDSPFQELYRAYRLEIYRVFEKPAPIGTRAAGVP